MFALSRFLTFLAGAWVSAALVRKKLGELDAHGRRLSGIERQLEAVAAELQPKIEALGRRLAASPDARIDELAQRISQLPPKIETLTGVVMARLDAVETGMADLRQTVGAQEEKLQAANQVVVAIEQLLSSKMAEFDRRLEAQGRTLQALNASIARSDQLLERAVALVRSGAPAGTEPRP